MAETMLALAVLQVVTPVAVGVMPAIWRQIVEALRWVTTTRTARDSSQDTNLACINTILDTLDRLPNLSWTSESHSQALLKQMKIKTESLTEMIEKDNAFKRFCHKRKFAKTIQSVALMMQLLEANVRARQTTTFYQCNANRDVNADRLDLLFYTKRKENLIQDLHAILHEDDLEPVLIRTREHYKASIERSGTYPRILYEFEQSEGSEASQGYPRTLTTSRGVRECIELLMKWLRDLKLMHETQNTGGSVLIGVALYESFTEILPTVLMDHLVARRSTLLPHTARQFSKNLRFLRSFSLSSTFKDIQGSNGLQLEEGDKVLNVDLRQPEWVTWENLQITALKDEMSSGGATRTDSGNIESAQECELCGLYFAGQSLDTEFARHSKACFDREIRLNSFKQMRCPVCHKNMDQLSEEERLLHANACLDRSQIGSGNMGWSAW